jgi:uncharacterized membrane protein YhaH (DUF805 family)
MSPTDAVRTVLQKYATFSGRARRSEYWWFALFQGVLILVLESIGLALQTKIFVVLALLVPRAASARAGGRCPPPA